MARAVQGSIPPRVIVLPNAGLGILIPSRRLAQSTVTRLPAVNTMVWPFGTSGSGNNKESHDEPKKRTVSWPDSLGNQETEPFSAAKAWAPMVMFSLVGLGALQLYANYLRRIPGTAYIRPNFFRNRSLYGRVTSVGDGDNFHLFHTPGGKAVGWGWLRKVPKTRKELKDRTIPIRIAGIDAPEGAHFGRPAQPYSDEALKWLQSYILNKKVRAYIYKKDQYDRVVATVYVRKFLFRKNVGMQMIKSGLATVYEAKSGAEFGGLEEKYKKAEAKAKQKRKGMWSGDPKAFESPREYKTKWAGVQNKEEGS